MNKTCRDVFSRALSEYQRCLLNGREPSFIRVTRDEWAAWVAFLQPTIENLMETKACGQYLVIV